MVQNNRHEEERGMSATETEQPPSNEERKTRELCGSEHDGLRCMRPKEHPHDHEAYTATRTITWK